jgi:hypothetical protein
MIQRLVAIDVLLITLLAYGGFRFRQDWLAFWTTHRVENIQAASETISTTPPVVVPAGSTLDDWTAIAVRNPFSFDRSDVPVIASQPTGEPVGPKPILFGTMSLGQGLVAMMATGQPGNRNARPMHVGELLDGWELVEIQEKSVVVRTGDRRENVIMNDPTAQVPRDATRTVNTSAASVVSTVPSSPQVFQGTSNNTRPSAASTDPDQRPLPPAPVDANGQPRKGRWVISPFGNVFVEGDR